MRNARTTATKAMIAASRKADCAPGAPASTTVRPAACPECRAAEEIEMSRAVPAAPATCCRVFSAAEPCEYRCRSSEASEAEKRGVYEAARPTDIPVCTTTSTQVGVLG